MVIEFAGVWPACPTPLTEQEDLDEAAMRRIVTFLASAGVHGLWFLGSGGEGVLVSEGVRRRAVEIVLDELDGAIPVLVGISAEGTKQALAKHRSLADLPIAGVFATAPFYYRCEQHEIAEFFRELAAQIGRPVIVYNNPHVGKVVIEPETILQLAEIEQIVGVKDTSGDFIFTQSILAATRGIPGFCVLQGYDELAAASMLAGADGVVSAIGCFAPRLLLDLTAAARVGDARRAFSLQHDVSDLVRQLGWGSSDVAYIRSTKAWLEVMGLCSRRVADPFAQASDEERRRVSQLLATVTEPAEVTG
jgi:4-hydroxy-tetrahydrodipicolinate synthase